MVPLYPLSYTPIAPPNHLALTIPYPPCTPIVKPPYIPTAPPNPHVPHPIAPVPPYCAGAAPKHGSHTGCLSFNSCPREGVPASTPIVPRAPTPPPPRGAPRRPGRPSSFRGPVEWGCKHFWGFRPPPESPQGSEALFPPGGFFLEKNKIGQIPPKLCFVGGLGGARGHRGAPHGAVPEVDRVSGDPSRLQCQSPHAS